MKVDDVLNSSAGKAVIDRFIDLYYQGGTAPSLNYRSLPILKNPCDLWVIIELFQELRPTLVVETGTHHGGSAIYYADMLKMFDIPCQVVTIDYNPKWKVDPASRGVTSLVGYSTDVAIVERVKKIAEDRQRDQPGHVMALLDADHSEDHTGREMRLYAPLITKGSYMIVEDTIVNGHPSFPEHGPGPWEAVQGFLKESDAFEIDRTCQRHLLTFFPDGWLRRVK